SLLLKRGRLSKEDLERAVVLHKQSGRPLGETLVDMEVFTPEDVNECLRMQVEEIIYNLFSWPEGEFDFREGAEPAGAPFLLQLATMSVIMEGTRRIDEWVEIEKIMPKDDVLLKMSSFPPTNEENVTVSLDEFRMLPLISGERTAPQIIDLAPIGEFSAYRALYRLIVGGYVESAGRTATVSITGMENEEEVVLNVIYYLYNSCLHKIRQIVDSSLGDVSSARLKFTTADERQDRHSITSCFPGFDTTEENTAAFDRFYTLVVKIPPPIRLHVLMNALESMLADQLELVFRFLGKGKYRSAVSAIKKEISEPLASRRELVKRYQIDKNFYAALLRADRVVKSAMS
ncbi:MAG: DUF4388 domain-containing protein, partial [Candidatus Zixiibacteriota bacterium]